MAGSARTASTRTSATAWAVSADRTARTTWTIALAALATTEAHAGTHTTVSPATVRRDLPEVAAKQTRMTAREIRAATGPAWTGLTSSLVAATPDTREGFARGRSMSASIIPANMEELARKLNQDFSVTANLVLMAKIVRSTLTSVPRTPASTRLNALTKLTATDASASLATEEGSARRISTNVCPIPASTAGDALTWWMTTDAAANLDTTASDARQTSTNVATIRVLTEEDARTKCLVSFVTVQRDTGDRDARKS